MPDDDRLPCDHNEVLEKCVNALKFCPSALTSTERILIRECQKDSAWHHGASCRRRMRKLFEKVTK